MEKCPQHADYKPTDQPDESILVEKNEINPIGRKGMEYERALKHLRGCNYRPQYCKNGCGAKILGSEFEEHSKVCPDYQEECSNCE